MIYASAQRGNDANNGSFGAPFRQISKAIQQSTAGGTVVVLDSGEYGSVRVDKAIEIVADAAQVEIRPAGGPGGVAVYVGAGPTGVVTLRGLSLKGAAGCSGVRVGSVQTLYVERCQISGFVESPEGFPTFGIEAFEAIGTLSVKDSVLSDNKQGISFTGGRSIIDGCSIWGDGTPNAQGLSVEGSSRVSVRASVVGGHGDTGVYVRGGDAVVALAECLITHNRIGLYADRASEMYLLQSTVTLNDIALHTLNNGAIYTTGNSSVAGNPTEPPVGSGFAFFNADLKS